MVKKQTTTAKTKWPEWKVWKTITLGTRKTVDRLRWAIERKKMSFMGGSQDLLYEPGFAMSHQIRKVNLALVQVIDLGFDDVVAFKDLFNAAQERGLRKCPAEVGPQLLLLQDNKTPAEEQYIIGMEPISNADGDLALFTVHYKDYMPEKHWWLDTYDLSEGITFTGPDYIVFMLP